MTGRWTSAIAAIALTAGCGPRAEKAVEGGGQAASSSGSGMAQEGETEPETTGALDGGTGGVETDGGSGGPAAPVSFLHDPDGGSVSHACSLWDQDCPPGEKCNVWANDGGGAWNATKCVPIDPHPDAPGDPCTVVGSGVSGVDSCDKGAMCWDVDAETNEGTCVAYCMGSENNPVCADPDTTCNVGRDFALCLPVCCPIEQDCAHEDEICIPVSNKFLCAPDASGDEGAFGDACEYVNVCDPGLVCLGGERVPGCVSAGCCTPFCTVGTNQCQLLDEDMECLPWFEDGQAPPGFEDVGACLLPE